MNNLLFFTAVDNGYKDFIPLYVYFANKYNENSCFEFLVKNLSKDFEDSMNNFAKEFNIKSLKLRNFNYKNIHADQLRFLEEPLTICNYTYIGDIDILINENILSFHLNQMKEFNTIYSNCVRYKNNNRISGLHFVKTLNWYGLTKNIRNNFKQLIEIKNNHIIDEILLKNIAYYLKINQIISENEEDFNLKRPIHGLHISLNRKPFTDKLYFPCELFKKMIINDLYVSPNWLKLEGFLSTNMKNILKVCENYVSK